MRLLLSVLTVIAANILLRASGPLMLGERPLPALAARVASLTAPVLLVGLIVTTLGGPEWRELDWTQVVGVGVAGALGLVRVPMLLAVAGGVCVTAVLRLVLGA